MKKRMMVVVMLTVMVMVALSAGFAQAAFKTCTVSQVGCNGDMYWLTATETSNAFTNMTFVIDDRTRGKEMFATALTAFANSTNLLLWVDPPYVNYMITWAVVAAK